jgi:hypothetical protein
MLVNWRRSLDREAQQRAAYSPSANAPLSKVGSANEKLRAKSR